MSTLTARPVLSEVLWHAPGAQVWTKRAILVLAGIALLTLAAQIKVAVPPIEAA